MLPWMDVSPLPGKARQLPGSAVQPVVQCSRSILATDFHRAHQYTYPSHPSQATELRCVLAVTDRVTVEQRVTSHAKIGGEAPHPGAPDLSMTGPNC